jgi:hypothetical protein
MVVPKGNPETEMVATRHQFNFEISRIKTSFSHQERLASQGKESTL